MARERLTVGHIFKLPNGKLVIGLNTGFKNVYLMLVNNSFTKKIQLNDEVEVYL